MFLVYNVTGWWLIYNFHTYIFLWRGSKSLQKKSNVFNFFGLSIFPILFCLTFFLMLTHFNVNFFFTIPKPGLNCWGDGLQPLSQDWLILGSKISNFANLCMNFCMNLKEFHDFSLFLGGLGEKGGSLFMILWYLHVRGILDWYDSTPISPPFPLVPKCMHSWWRIYLALNIQFMLCLYVCLFVRHSVDTQSCVFIKYFILLSHGNI